MSWLICIIGLAFAALLFGGTLFVRSDRIANAMFIGAIAVSIIMVCSLVGMGLRTAARHLDRVDCDGYGSQEQAAPTRFVDYSYWGWDCLVWSEPDGLWIPKHNYRL